ncbi:MAG: YfcE family phosphodiesterase [Clostridiales bacterium]|nr:YfcE family phosphodiesterase [Clostridiales bacterium]
MCEKTEKKQYKIVVVSDSHHETSRLERLLPIINSADYFVFCGDGAADVMWLRGRITVPIACVKGNNDFWIKEQLTDVATVAFGHARALIVHGHRHGVRHGLALLMETAMLKDYKLVFFGHTHHYTDVEYNGVHFINPGALCEGSYAIVTGDGDSFTVENHFIS